MDMILGDIYITDKIETSIISLGISSVSSKNIVKDIHIIQVYQSWEFTLCFYYRNMKISLLFDMQFTNDNKCNQLRYLSLDKRIR